MAYTIPKTLEEIEALPREMLTAVDISSVFRMSDNAIRVRARNAENGGKGLPFPFYYDGKRLRIPKRSFVRWMRGE